jgi:LPS-assembly protein
MIVKSIFKKIIITIFIVFLLVPFVFASNEVGISADELEYDELGERVVAQGHVVLDWQDKKIFADHVEFLINKKSMTASGNVTIEENGDTIHSESIVYNYDDETGEIKETFSSSSNLLFMRSKSMDRIGKDTFKLKHVTFSTCDLDKPHTYFKSTRGKLVLNKRITIYNAIFYIGKIPVFYLPFITKSLKGGWGFGSRFKLTVVPGYNDTEGFTLKTTVSCALSENSIAKVTYDHLGRRGAGYGGEFNYVTNGGILNIYTYTTKDLIDKRERWVFRPNYFQSLNNNWKLQLKGEFVSDNEFNNTYDQSNWNRTEEKLRSYAALTRQGLKTDLQLNIEYNASWDKTKSKYGTDSIKLPNLTWGYRKRELVWGIMHGSSFEYSDIYNSYKNPDEKESRKFYKNTAKIGYNLSKPFKAGRRFTLTPGLDISESWYDRNNKNKLENSCFTFYGGTFNTRFRLTSWIYLNARYRIEARTKRYSVGIDTDDQDYGINTNNINLSDDIFVGDRITIRNSITYDLKRYRNRKMTPKDQWTPLSTELTWAPKYYITVFIVERQRLDTFKFNSLNIDVSVGDHSTKIKPYFNFGIFYEVQMKDRIKNNIGFGVWLNPKWRLEYIMRSTIAMNVMYSISNDYELKLYRDSHCYNLAIVFRRRSVNDRSCFLKIDMKTNMPFSKRSNNLGYDDNPSEIFYPWREFRRDWDIPLGYLL